MSCNLNLQRNSKVFYSTVDLAGGAAVGSMTPANTWRIEVLAGYAVSQDAATQDISASESGLTPDRSITRFNTAINPAEWSLQAYLRPTGDDSINSGGDGVSDTANVKPVADWFLWQAALSNTAPASGTNETSAWEDGGVFRSIQRAASANVALSNPNFAVAQENYLYIQMDNVVYQVSNAAINEATVDASIDGIATTSWSGYGTAITELTGTIRNNAISVFGGTLNDGTTATSNANALTISKAASYHPWASYNVAGTVTPASFIKNRLSSIDIFHTPAGAAAVNYTFPITSLSWSLNNNITYLTPEELATLNYPIGNFSGSRSITSSFSAYLRHGTTQSAALLRNILADTRTSHSAFANANIKVGGATAPYVAFYMPATQYSLPTHAIEDIISIQVELQAQESATNCGLGDEVTVFTKKS